MTNMNRHVDHKTIHAAEWSVAEAKSRFSEVVARARSGQPQRVTRYGKDEVVVVSASEWARYLVQGQSAEPAVKPGESLLDMFDAIRESGAGEELADILDRIIDGRRLQPFDPSLLQE